MGIVLGVSHSVESYDTCTACRSNGYFFSTFLELAALHLETMIVLIVLLITARNMSSAVRM